MRTTHYINIDVYSGNAYQVEANAGTQVLQLERREEEREERREEESEERREEESEERREEECEERREGGREGGKE